MAYKPRGEKEGRRGHLLEIFALNGKGKKEIQLGGCEWGRKKRRESKIDQKEEYFPNRKRLWAVGERKRPLRSGRGTRQGSGGHKKKIHFLGHLTIGEKKTQGGGKIASGRKRNAQRAPGRTGKKKEKKDRLHPNSTSGGEREKKFRGVAHFSRGGGRGTGNP